MSLKLKICEDYAVWDDFVQTSPQGCVFSSSPFLRACAKKFDLYFVMEKGLPVMAVPIADDGGQMFTPYTNYTTVNYSLYQGPMFAGRLEAEPEHSLVQSRLEVMDFLLNELTNRYQRLSFSLHPSYPDLRSFLWFNYHDESAGRFAVNLRYTALIDLPATAGVDYRNNLRRNRRRDLTAAEGAGVTVCEYDDASKLNALMDLTYQRQSLTRDPEDVAMVNSVCQAALRENFGKYLVAKTADGEIISAHLIVFDKSTAYSLYGGNHPDHRESGAGTLLLYRTFELLRDQGHLVFDFLGINSPNRGDYKTSFNARPTPYFAVSWVKSQCNQ